MTPPERAGSETAAGHGESLIYLPRSIVERLHFDALFPKPQPLEVELGSGDGSFIVQYAQANPQHNFLAVERLLGRLRKIDRKGRRAGLLNLRAMRIEASYLLEFLLPRETVRALHIYFPDPWPKRRHHGRRLINERFTEIAQQALEPGGAVYLRTDDAEYFKQMTGVFGANAAFEAIETPPALKGLLTDFEREFQAKGIQTLRAAYRRRA